MISLMIIGSNMVYIFQYGLEFDERDDLISKSLLWVTLFMILLACIFVIIRDFLRFEYDESLGKVVRESTMWENGRYKMMAANIILMTIQPYPFLVGIRINYYAAIVDETIYYHVNDILQLLSTFRIVGAVANLVYLTNWLSNSSSRIW